MSVKLEVRGRSREIRYTRRMAGAEFVCFAGCGERYPLDEIVYRCKRCGSLLDVEQDLDALKQRSAAAWMTLFDRRWMRTEWPYGSGVWGKKEWVCPEVRNENVVSSMFAKCAYVFRAANNSVAFARLPAAAYPAIWPSASESSSPPMPVGSPAQ